ncbi:glycosyltransferase [Marinobacter sp. CA1]|uniref:glycosyltransferase n=1 Tax=Marinobacter sp. CA1 TaxID=2817656 RepID=UPI001D098213|nr:glycosyltransferase [Marinobacter sp. CA1]UDL04438.1 glycosyltransferase [Marinobacter sp. CA1]
MASPLQIAQVVATPGTTWGGMEQHTADLCAGLSQRGHRVTVLAHPDYRAEFQTVAEFLPVPTQLGRRHPRLWWLLRKRLLTLQPQICHAQGNKAAQLCRHGLRLWPGNVPHPRLIGTVHGHKSSMSAFQNLDGVIAVNDALARALPENRVRRIYNGLPNPPPGPPGLAIPATRPLLLAAGRLEPVKQFDRLIQAWAQLTRQGAPGLLVILGEGSQRPVLERLITTLGMTSRVLLPGREHNLSPWYRAADACVVSSSREGFGYVIAEALMAGCPVLSTPVGIAPALLPTDALSTGTTTDELAALLQHHWQHRQGLRQHQQQSMRQSRQTFTLEAMVRETERYYFEMLV